MGFGQKERDPATWAHRRFLKARPRLRANRGDALYREVDHASRDVLSFPPRQRSRSSWKRRGSCSSIGERCWYGAGVGQAEGPYDGAVLELRECNPDREAEENGDDLDA